MGKATKRKPAEEIWNEKHGCDGRPPHLVDGIADVKSRTRAQRNTNHCTLCRLHHLGFLKDSISDNSHGAKALSDLRRDAGKRLQDDVALAGQSSMPGALGAIGGGSHTACGPAEIAQMRIDADRRKAAAMLAVGTSARFLLEKIIIADWTLEEASQIMRVKKNAVLPALRVALDALSAHYGLSQVARARIRGGDVKPIHPFNSV